MSAPPQDQQVRERMVTDLDTTLFIEAGAGTGKTTAVVSRVVALVIDGLEIDRLVAITFTEASAAELRVRLRKELEKAAHDAVRTVEDRERAQAAVEGLDAARIDTIHGFASALLRTWPIEAGLPPGFTVLDDIEQQVIFRERLRSWLDGLEGESPAGRTVQRALLGLKPTALLDATPGLEENHDLLTRTTSWPCPAPPDAVEMAHRLGRELCALEELLDLCHAPDVLHDVVVDVQFAARRLCQADEESAALVALQLIERIKVGQKGRTQDWGLRDGANACTTIKACIGAAASEAAGCLTAHRTEALSRVLVELRDLVLDSVDERRRRGDATFHDLLTGARDLLRDHPDVRRTAQSRWDRILVDEFQDTDPLQVELAFLLSAEPASLPAEDWRNTRLVPGKLTLVGDPKQSIYRFRRGDIAAYSEVETAIAGNGGTTLYLTENFRSVPRVIDFINHHFSLVMRAAEQVQPEYVPLTAHHAGSGSGVWRMGEEMTSKMPDVWQAEATNVARAVRHAVEDAWSVHDSADGVRTARPARWDDICILIPTRTNLRRLERALQDEDVPYQVASGSLIVATQEVRDLVSCLRAIDDPSDQVAVVAALRSPAFGVDDVELLRWREAGGGLDYQRSADGDGERIRAAFAGLDRLHQRRHEASPAALIESFVGDRLLVAAAAAERRPSEVWRRYRYVAARARAFAATGRTTLRAFLDWMEGLQRDQVRDSGGTSVDTSEEAVRIMTIHGAKGLEFPIIALTGCGSVRQFQAPSCIPDRREQCLDFNFGDFRTARFADQKSREKEMDTAESLRQMYVATTRARDHLILSLYRRGRGSCHAADFADSLRTFGEVPVVDTGERPARLTIAGDGIGPQSRTPEEHRREEEEWVARRARLIAAHRALDVRSATGIAHQGETAEPEQLATADADVAAHRRGRAGTSLGRAVHAVLQVIDLNTLDGLEELVRAQATVEGIAGREGDVANLVRVACASEAVRRALQGGRYWRELPVGVHLDGVLLEGFIDLVYEEPDGSLVVVDHKTDDVSAGEVEGRTARYRLQGGAYALALERVTGRRVVRVEFVFASPRITRALPDLAGAVAEVREQLSRGPDVAHAGVPAGGA
ncbi:MAG: UvrD-helicase domain-containing protein [Candidatus Dormibacteria bacterium]